MLTVPPVYACSEFALAAQDNYVRQSIEAYAQWGWQDDRVAGLNAWHYNTRQKRQEGPPCPCDQRVGADQLPESLQELRRTGLAIKNLTM